MKIIPRNINLTYQNNNQEAFNNKNTVQLKTASNIQITEPKYYQALNKINFRQARNQENDIVFIKDKKGGIAAFMNFSFLNKTHKHPLFLIRKQLIIF